MLVQLNIHDFAIIRRLELPLREGLNILSGETGTGKSIIINAINLILGGRSSVDLIRSGSKEAVVEAFFEFPENMELRDHFLDQGISFDGELLIKRNITREGRNKIFINGAMVTLQMLSRLGPRLISISGQHEHQTLLNPENHLVLLDDFSSLAEERNLFHQMFNRHQTLKEEIGNRKKEIGRQEEKKELARFQIQEIEQVAVVSGEDKSLLEEKKRLQHAEELMGIVTRGYQVLYENNDSILSSLGRCTKEVGRAAEIDQGLAQIEDGLNGIQAGLEDMSFALRDYQKHVEIDPVRLEQVAERLDELNRLKRKYGPELENILRLKDKLISEISHMEISGKRLSELEQEAEIMEKDLFRKAKALSVERKKGADIFKEKLEKELFQLHMDKTEFQVRFRENPPGEENSKIGPDGIDHLEFMISPNPGEILKPLSKIASGGELSRIMLAIKSILASTASVETIIFDEVDAGISGATAEVVGKKIKALSVCHQMLCITHLPQIASQGNSHFAVKKEVASGRTEVSICCLDPAERVHEIARLLGGSEITPQAVAHAEDMLIKGGGK